MAFLLTGGQAADCRAAENLLQSLAPATLVMADRAYDTNAIRKQIENQDAVPNIPPRCGRTRIGDDAWGVHLPALGEGNHDNPQHRIELLACLDKAGKSVPIAP